MDILIIFFITFGFLLLSMFVGNWIFVALGLTGILGLGLVGPQMLSMMVPIAWGSLAKMVISALPLFIFLGVLILEARISVQTYDGFAKLLAFLPGGLLHVNVASCAAFAAISGSSMATTATIGTVAIPEEKRRGYDRKLILGSIAASGTLGILIPPSANMIIYGAFMEVSIGRLFAGGVIPGLIMAVSFMTFIAIRVKLHPSLGPSFSYSGRAKLAALKDLAPITIVMVFIFVAIFGGIMTPTETAAGAVVVVLIIVAVRRQFSWRLVYKSAIRCLGVSCMVSAIMASASIVAYALNVSGVAEIMVKWLLAKQYTTLQIIIAIYIMYLILGCFMEGIAMMLMTLPFILPILNSLNIDLIWFGVILILLVEQGMITPPLGDSLYVTLGIDKEATFGDVVHGIVPFLLIQIGILALLTAKPNLVLFFPNLVFGA